MATVNNTHSNNFSTVVNNTTARCILNSTTQANTHPSTIIRRGILARTTMMATVTTIRMIAPRSPT